MICRVTAGLVFASVVLCANVGLAVEQEDIEKGSEPLVLSRAGVMFVGGRRVQVPGFGRGRTGGEQTQMTGDAPVHYLIPEVESHKTPVVMVPGLGLTSYIYLSTPDGREGWAQRFVRAGFAAYVMDPPNTGVSGFRVGSSEEAGAGGAASFMVWPNESVWQRWGFGPEPGVPFDDTRYPVKDVDQLLCSITPVYTGGGRQSGGTGRRGRGGGRGRSRRGGGMAGSSDTSSALGMLLQKTGPAVVIVHSAAGRAGFNVARAHSELVKALIVVEPVGAVTDPAEIRLRFADTPYLAVFGDHFESRRMQGRFDGCREMARLLTEAGGRAEVMRLPELGIHGNTHLLMQDNNSHDIAGKIIRWINGAVED